jgi:hypothetical protein
MHEYVTMTILLEIATEFDIKQIETAKNKSSLYQLLALIKLSLKHYGNRGIFGKWWSDKGNYGKNLCNEAMKCFTMAKKLKQWSL